MAIAVMAIFFRATHNYYESPPIRQTNCFLNAYLNLTLGQRYNLVLLEHRYYILNNNKQILHQHLHLLG